jgi:hypothetical protein
LETLETLGWVVAAYGAALSTYLGYKSLNADRARLDFRFSVEYPDAEPDARRTGNWGMRYLKLRVVNTGRRPIALETVGVIYRLDLFRASSAAVRTQNRPDSWKSFEPARLLGEYDSVDAFEEADGVLGQMLYNWPEGPWHLWEAFATDASGSVHHARLRGWYDFGHETGELHRAESPAYQHGRRSPLYVVRQRLSNWRDRR